jgi:hypothetical protein
MRDWIAGAMTVLGTLLVLSGAAIIILRAWGERTETAVPASSTVDRQAVDPLAVDPLATVTTTAPRTVTPLPERGARALHRLGPPDRSASNWAPALPRSSRSPQRAAPARESVTTRPSARVTTRSAAPITSASWLLRTTVYPA